VPKCLSIYFSPAQVPDHGRDADATGRGEGVPRDERDVVDGPAHLDRPGGVARVPQGLQHPSRDARWKNFQGWQRYVWKLW
jgi:hypothetical protein